MAEVQPYTKAERLLNLMMALRGTTVGLSRDQIRSVVRGYDQAAPGAFERMFERDKDELRAMGVPVITLTDASGVVTGYRIAGDWTLPSLDLDRVELAVLGLAARAWRSADLAPAALTALRKVEARVGMRSEPDAVAPVAGLSADSPVLTVLIEACSQRAPVRFRYRKPTDEVAATRHVEPWGVVWWRGHWYVVGHDRGRSGTRVFRASRIEGAVRRDGPAAAYEVPEGIDVRTMIGRFAASDRVGVEVALAPGVGTALRRRSVGVGIDERGWDVVRVEEDTVVAGVAAALAQCPEVRVVGPEPAAAEAVRQLEAIIAAHEAPAAQPLGTEPGRGRPAAAGQFPRLLALVPWLAANSGVTVAAAAAHFGITEEQLVADLGSVITSGADDWTLFDIQYWDTGGVIEVIDPLELGRPLQLTPDEGFALMVALQALAAIPGSHDRTVLERVLATLSAALGSRAPAPGVVSVRVDLPDEVVDRVAQAQSGGRAMDLAYLGLVRDQVTRRVIDPVGVVVVDGYGYLRARCRRAGQLRMFRLDRIIDLRVSDLPAEPVTDTSVQPMSVALAETGRRVRIDAPAGSAVLDGTPTTRRWALPGGWVRADMPVGDYEWAARLALAGAGHVVVREPEWLADRVVGAARQALGRHRGSHLT